MKVNSLWNPLSQIHQGQSPAPLGTTVRPQNIGINVDGWSGQTSKFTTSFRLPGLFRYQAKDADDVVIHTPWGGSVPSDQPVEKKPEQVPAVPRSVIIEQRRRRQEEDDQRSWDNVLRIPVESPEDRARWIEEQKRREDAEKNDRRDERGVVIIDYSV